MRKRIASAVMAAWELARSVRHLAPSGVWLAVCGMAGAATVEVGEMGAPMTLVDGGTYVFKQSVTYDAPATNSAIKLASGTAHITIPEGVTVTLKGGDAEGAIGAGAGIEVAEGATLCILGAGILDVKGGDAANGTDGGKGEAAWWEQGIESMHCGGGV